MRTADFDFSLPDRLIAQSPGPRGESRLLLLGSEGAVAHHRIGDLPRLLRRGDLLLVNDTKVIPARLLARRPTTGGQLELLLVERVSARNWVALAKPGRRATAGHTFALDGDLAVEVIEKRPAGKVLVRFSEPIEPHLDRLGHVPLPPYIRRPDQAADRVAYQTVYAREPGAIAAPTAGLHFTSELLEALRLQGIGTSAITLHVGIGTFRPVTAESVDDHKMDCERFEISAATATAIERTQAHGGRIVAVGTTVVRTLETVMQRCGTIQETTGTTDLFIRPGFQFGVVDLLLTNFHLPRSTLLMLVCAFAGRSEVLEAYQQAIEEGYRFYSYGDCMLVNRAAAREAH
jgi:S-adenosylmethionine:tRNA ribosyltransferase-isomerase